jgi:hypothetical protein
MHTCPPIVPDLTVNLTIDSAIAPVFVTPLHEHFKCSNRLFSKLFISFFEKMTISVVILGMIEVGSVQRDQVPIPMNHAVEMR